MKEFISDCIHFIQQSSKHKRDGIRYILLLHRTVIRHIGGRWKKHPTSISSPPSPRGRWTLNICLSALNWPNYELLTSQTDLYILIISSANHDNNTSLKSFLKPDREISCPQFVYFYNIWPFNLWFKKQNSCYGKPAVVLSWDMCMHMTFACYVHFHLKLLANL